MRRRRDQDLPIHGILNVNKPAGWTSFDVVAYIRGRSGVRRAGHGGTLDPAATGVLPVGLGAGTRFLEYLMLGRKEYLATVHLGVTTATDDAEGDVIETRPVDAIGTEAIQNVLPQFLGEIWQTPPMYSAIKRGGTPLYKLARAGEQIDREPRRVHVYDLRLLTFHPPRLELMIQCGRGTYIRSLARDLGEALGCGAHLEALTRTRVGPFHLRESQTIDALPPSPDVHAWRAFLHGADIALVEAPAAIVSLSHADDLRMGRAVQLAPERRARADQIDSDCRAYDVDGNFVAVIRFDRRNALWKPVKVMRDTSQLLHQS